MAATRRTQRWSLPVPPTEPKPRRKFKDAGRGELDLEALQQAVCDCRYLLEPYRVNRKAFVAQYAGDVWSSSGATAPVYVNEIALYVQIISQKLISKNPRVMLSTFEREHKPTVSAMESWVNEAVEQIALSDTLAEAVVDAIFSLGVVKVGLAAPTDAMVSGYTTPAGRPFALKVDLDDFVVDMYARNFREVDFIGHRCRVPFEAVKDSKLFDKKAVKDLKPTTRRIYNESGDERIGELGRQLQYKDEFDDKVDLWELYLPRRKQIVTMMSDEGGQPSGEEPLDVREWLGPECGPYHMLGLAPVPGNLYPLSPVMNLYRMHMLINNIWRKLAAQAERQKDITFVYGKEDQDGKRTVEANDGDVVRVENPEGIKPVSFGGPNPALFQFGEASYGRFSAIAGNLESLGGLSPQSKTAKQDEMLAASSGAMIAAMQETTLKHVTSVVRALCWYWHHDPYKVMQTTFSFPGLPEMQLGRKTTPQDRMKVPFNAIRLKIDPYSLVHQTPQQRLSALNAVVQQTILPMLPILQQQGMTFDINSYLQKVAKYLDLPDLPEIVTIGAAPQQEQAGSSAPREPNIGMLKPGMTERRYVRENRSERTEAGNRMLRENALLGINSGGARRQEGVMR